LMIKREILVCFISPFPWSILAYYSISWSCELYRNKEQGLTLIVAAAKWIFHDDSDEARWEQQIEPVWIEAQARGNAGPGVEDYEYVKWALEEMNWRRRERFRGPGAMLDLLFVAPAHHRRGAGKLLVQWGTKQADE
jgi:GNAT superfamily N-acetyltransferase